MCWWTVRMCFYRHDVACVRACGNPENMLDTTVIFPKAKRIRIRVLTCRIFECDSCLARHILRPYLFRNSFCNIEWITFCHDQFHRLFRQLLHQFWFGGGKVWLAWQYVCFDWRNASRRYFDLHICIHDTYHAYSRVWLSKWMTFDDKDLAFAEIPYNTHLYFVFVYQFGVFIVLLRFTWARAHTFTFVCCFDVDRRNLIGNCNVLEQIERKR